MSAEAVAQASACAFATQTKGCNSVKNALTQQAYSSAFVSITAKAWSNACALGYGKAHGEGEATAKALVTVLSRAFGDIVAKACSECDTCNCKSLPAGLNWDNLKGASDTAAAAADGRYTMSRAFSSAAATYCASDKTPRSLKVGAGGLVAGAGAGTGSGGLGWNRMGACPVHHCGTLVEAGRACLACVDFQRASRLGWATMGSATYCPRSCGLPFLRSLSFPRTNPRLPASHRRAWTPRSARWPP